MPDLIGHPGSQQGAYETGAAAGRSDQAALLRGEADEVVVVPQRQAFHQPRAVGFHGLDADPQQLGHFAGGVSLPDQAQQLSLARGQAIDGSITLRPSLAAARNTASAVLTAGWVRATAGKIMSTIHQ